MSKNDNPVILGFAALLTLGLMGGGLFVFNRISPRIFNQGGGGSITEGTWKLEQGQVKLC
ncbi:MAG: hypothetical protein HC799_00350 [Limnothrix sp. RL_2_0]|nr:hypothetical protein [Limnothrix sp. RL_2_0]